MFDAFRTFGASEWLRLAFTVLLCIPLFVIGMYLFGLFPEIIAGTDTAKRKRKTEDAANDPDARGTAAFAEGETAAAQNASATKKPDKKQ